MGLGSSVASRMAARLIFQRAVNYLRGTIYPAARSATPLSHCRNEGIDVAGQIL
jgi:hypothetical protein